MVPTAAAAAASCIGAVAETVGSFISKVLPVRLFAVLLPVLFIMVLLPLRMLPAAAAAATAAAAP